MGTRGWLQFAELGATCEHRPVHVPPLLRVSSLWILAVLVLVCGAETARAQVLRPQRDHKIHVGDTHASPRELRVHNGLVLGAKLGAALAFSRLEESPALELELGYMLPFPLPVAHSFEVFVSGGYQAHSTRADAVLPSDARARYRVTQQVLAFTLGLRYRLPVAADIVMPYVSAGARLHALRASSSSEAAREAFGDSTDASLAPGFMAAMGGEIYVGPGAFVLELQLGYTPLQSELVPVAALVTCAGLGGYRLMF